MTDKSLPPSLTPGLTFAITTIIITGNQILNSSLHYSERIAVLKTLDAIITTLKEQTNALPNQPPI